MEATGFQAAVGNGINLDIAQKERLDFSLKVGAVSQQPEVTARLVTVTQHTRYPAYTRFTRALMLHSTL